MSLAAAPSSRTARNAVYAGIALMLVGDFMFALNDAMGKWLVASFSVGQVLLIRSVGAFLILGPMLVRQGGSGLWSVQRPWLQVARVILATADTALFYAAVVYLPLADVMTFYMAGPIHVAALAHFLLGEKIGWRRWLAILIGFGGVVIALRPSAASFSLPSLFALAGSVCFSLTMILGRTLRATSDATLVTWQTLGALAAGIVLALADWRTPTPLDLGAMLLLGVVSCAAHLMITRALKLAPATTLAPLQYSLLLWAVLFGIVFFSDWPDAYVIGGSIIIVLAGLFIFHRERIRTAVPAVAAQEDVV